MKGLHAIIVSGGRLGDWALSFIHEGTYLIGVDAGASFLVKHGKQMDAALGDFDSVTTEEIDVIKQNSNKFQICDPIDKDLTDTELGLRFAIEQGADIITIIGGIGTRFDHSLANVHLLKMTLEEGITCKIVDLYNQIQLANDKLNITNDGYEHVSLLPLSSKVTGVTLNGFKYPLQNATLSIGMSLGISNILINDIGSIEIDEGELLIIQSRD
ncbi:thiamine diphosphokinase [Bacillus solimangrovi]|uniref:Thiamine diphosphokinase n=1 Tax=Bacillus solimangrovi TaxID=1305675 RepID=A0A1E5LF66_9BACI|nr:thiamine diphosphokinase [Bacillus solimangrovi]OEH92717.1 thiamine diphosphokinase [Bacillus solimangrovi]